MSVPERHPGGRTCDRRVGLALLLFIPLVARGMWRDRRNLGEVWEEVKK